VSDLLKALVVCWATGVVVTAMILVAQDDLACGIRTIWSEYGTLPF
jgi:hypothetical protein